MRDSLSLSRLRLPLASSLLLFPSLLVSSLAHSPLLRHSPFSVLATHLAGHLEVHGAALGVEDGQVAVRVEGRELRDGAADDLLRRHRHDALRVLLLPPAVRVVHHLHRRVHVVLARPEEAGAEALVRLVRKPHPVDHLLRHARQERRQVLRRTNKHTGRWGSRGSRESQGRRGGIARDSVWHHHRHRLVPPAPALLAPASERRDTRQPIIQNLPLSAFPHTRPSLAQAPRGGVTRGPSLRCARAPASARHTLPPRRLAARSQPRPRSPPLALLCYRVRPLRGADGARGAFGARWRTHLALLLAHVPEEPAAVLRPALRPRHVLLRARHGV